MMTWQEFTEKVIQDAGDDIMAGMFGKDTPAEALYCINKWGDGGWLVFKDDRLSPDEVPDLGAPMKYKFICPTAGNGVLSYQRTEELWKIVGAKLDNLSQIYHVEYYQMPTNGKAPVVKTFVALAETPEATNRVINQQAQRMRVVPQGEWAEVKPGYWECKYFQPSMAIQWRHKYTYIFTYQVREVLR